MAYLIQILISVMMATFMAMMIPRASVSAERIGEVLATESSVAEPVQAVTDIRPGSEIIFDKVDFQYPGAESAVLQGVSFRAEPGKTTAVIGSTGSGKTTLVNLVPRLFDITGGSLTIGGVDVRDVDLDTLWSRIGLVPQRPYLFTGTVASNLRYGNPDATDEELWEALRVAQAKDFVEQMPDRLESLSPRAAPTSPVGNGSGWPSREPWCASRRSTSSTTPSRRWTCRPTPGCGPPCDPSPGTPR